ncbi:MAG: DUF2202 domain-containing protein [Methanothrix sp.]|nr:DUF2202 domain-containing protein [Methanothrix sp.]MDD3709350.1 DUF2202 domain-containing protein [Methanothrix sp.]MDD5767492.1 DUF2202 domain-containing protein [Methanothrix sp.]
MVVVGPARSGYSGGEMEISWRNDQEHLYMALRGKTSGWLSIGFDPLEWMKDADMILGTVEDGEAIVLDEYSSGNYGPHEDDTFFGGSYDILESGGLEVDGHTVVEFKRRLNTGDKFDEALTPGQSVSIIWAMADSKSRYTKHNVAYGEAILVLASGDETAIDQISGTSAATLSPREEEGVLFIWEEEKVARDLYKELYRETEQSIFMDLARSEQSHMDQAKTLIDKYDLKLPVKDEPGVFSNSTLINLYKELLARGMQSQEDALKVAATFEEISIVDLERELKVADNDDMRVVFQGLLAGSRKHLRSYVMDLQDMNIEYTPQYMSPREFDEVVKD